MIKIYKELIDLITSKLINKQNVILICSPGYDKELLINNLRTNLYETETNIYITSLDTTEMIQYKGIELFPNQPNVDQHKIEDYLKTKRIILIVDNWTTSFLDNFRLLFEQIPENIRNNISILFLYEESSVNVVVHNPPFSSFVINIYNLSQEETNEYINHKHLGFKQNIKEDLFNTIYEYSSGNPALITVICKYLTYHQVNELPSKESLISNELVLQVVEETIEYLLSSNIVFPQSKNALFYYYLTKYYPKTYDEIFVACSDKEKVLVHKLLRFRNIFFDQKKLNQILGNEDKQTVNWALYKYMERLKNKLYPFINLSNKRNAGWFVDSTKIARKSKAKVHH